MNEKKIEQLRGSILTAIERVVENRPKVRSQVMFYVLDKFGEEQEEHTLVLSKHGGRFWVWVDDQVPAETVNVRMLLAVPAALEQLDALLASRAVEQEGLLDDAIKTASRIADRAAS